MARPALSTRVAVRLSAAPDRARRLSRDAAYRPELVLAVRPRPLPRRAPCTAPDAGPTQHRRALSPAARPSRAGASATGARATAQRDGGQPVLRTRACPRADAGERPPGGR